MFEIKEADGRVLLIGRFDAAQAEKAKEFLYGLEESTILDCSQLKFCASAGFGVLFEAQRRLGEAEQSLTLINLSDGLRELFRIGGFDKLMKIE